MNNPIAVLRREADKYLSRLSEELGVEKLELSPSDRRSQGYFTVKLHKYRNRLSESLVLDVLSRVPQSEYFSSVSFVNWYINIDINIYMLAKMLVEIIGKIGSNYGRTGILEGAKYLIEHTSANPVHPLHVGHGRNSILGDSLARLLRFCGADVSVHFYVDDCGAQVMYMALGYSTVKDYVDERISKGVKPDHVMGTVYSTTYAIGEINRLKKLKESAGEEKVREILSEMDEWLGVLRRNMEEDPELVDALVRALGNMDVERVVNEWNRAYERRLDEKVVRIVREAVSLVLEGQKATLKRLGIEIDSWDWESELTVWNGAAYDIVHGLEAKWPHYIERKEGSIIFDAPRFVEDMKLRGVMDLPSFVPKVTLVRSDGTTLYTTRDMAYALWQHRCCSPHKVIRVIASEQAHPQAHVRIVLYALGYVNEALNTVHYSYEIVNLPGRRMSARRGEYVSLDDILDEATERAAERTKDLDNAAETAERIGVGAIRHIFASNNPRRPIEFKWDKVMDFRQNSGPFLQYTYVRARSILRKAGGEPSMPVEIPKEIEDLERDLVVKLAEFPDVVESAALNLRPDHVADYLNTLALIFNSYYEKYPVLSSPEPYRSFRLVLMRILVTVLENGFYILGIPTIERM